MAPPLDFSGQSFAFSAAILAATISILLGGMLFGVGLAFGLRRIRLAGQEEIAQGIISAAMAGGIISFAVLLDSLSAQAAFGSSLPVCPSVQNPSQSAFSAYLCHLESRAQAYLRLAGALSRSSDICGFAGSLVVSAGAVQAQPFFSLEAASKSLFGLSQDAYWLHAIASMQFQAADALRAGALLVFLPAGLLLRTFFATRKIGAAAMAAAVSIYMFFPLLFLYTFPASKALAESQRAAEASEEFNSQFASIPLLDLEQPSSVRSKMDFMAQQDFSSRLQPIFSLSSRAVALGFPDLVLYPILSLLLSLVAAAQLYSIFSMQIFLPRYDLI
ncbi:MAG: hypothetical protein N3F07_00945 [Candidatus Micrarchaeota archaeon]|nr:hypothetical protein [Candidatus Micrarchaeota archaeon]